MCCIIHSFSKDKIYWVELCLVEASCRSLLPSSLCTASSKKQGINPTKQLLRQTNPHLSQQNCHSLRMEGGSAGGWTRKQAGYWALHTPVSSVHPGRHMSSLWARRDTRSYVVDPASTSRCFPGNAVMLPLQWFSSGASQWDEEPGSFAGKI